jgi:hypothetical protein
VEWADAHGDELGGERVAPVRADEPAATEPFQVHDLGVEQRVIVQAVVFADAAAVLEDLGRVRVLLGRHVAGLFQQRHVHVRGRVALRARVAVPVPGAAEVSRFVDDADVVDTRLLQPRTGDQAGEAAADARDRHVVGLRLALGPRRVRVVKVVREAASEAQVLVVAVRAQPFVALLAVFAAKSFFVENGADHAASGSASMAG